MSELYGQLAPYRPIRLTEGSLRSLIARATPLWDRARSSDPQLRAEDLKRSARRFERWGNILGSVEALERRLTAAGRSTAGMSAIVAGADVDMAVSWPEWAGVLSELQRRNAMLQALAPDEYADPAFLAERPLVFQEVLLGFVHVGRERFEAACGAAGAVLAARAKASLERQLLAHLTFVAALVLGRTFYEFRFAQAPASALDVVWREREPSRALYLAFVRHMHGGGLDEVFESYPVLARLMCRSVLQWTAASADVCARFQHDFAELRAFFRLNVELPEGAIVDVSTGLSDRHHDGQTVLRCRLSCGAELVYKPRTVRPERAFARFIDWMNARDPGLHLSAPCAFDRGSHGWVAAIPFRACADRQEVERFYTRAGMLLMSLYVLAATDIHYENLIASGEHPVVVDLETILCGRRSRVRVDPATAHEPEDREEPLILGIGLLPRWTTAADGRAFDLSGLGADASQYGDIRFATWRLINTDQMQMADEVPAVRSVAHRVHFNGVLPTVFEHVEAFTNGFARMYDWFLRHRDELQRDDALLAEFEGLDVRVLVRDSATYGRLQLQLLHPEYLQDGIDRSIELDWLARPLSGPARPQEGRLRLYESERTAMERLDIPHFSACAWDDLALSGDEDLAELHGPRDASVLLSRLKRLSPEHRTEQLRIIRDALASRFA